jgi:hypothetical protein
MSERQPWRERHSGPDWLEQSDRAPRGREVLSDTSEMWLGPDVSDEPPRRATDPLSYRPATGPTDNPAYHPTDNPAYHPTDNPAYRPASGPTDNPGYRTAAGPTDDPAYRASDRSGYRRVDPLDRPASPPADELDYPIVREVPDPAAHVPAEQGNDRTGYGPLPDPYSSPLADDVTGATPYPPYRPFDRPSYRRPGETAEHPDYAPIVEPLYDPQAPTLPSARHRARRTPSSQRGGRWARQLVVLLPLALASSSWATLGSSDSGKLPWFPDGYRVALGSDTSTTVEEDKPYPDEPDVDVTPTPEATTPDPTSSKPDASATPEPSDRRRSGTGETGTGSGPGDGQATSAPAPAPKPQPTRTTPPRPTPAPTPTPEPTTPAPEPRQPGIPLPQLPLPLPLPTVLPLPLFALTGAPDEASDSSTEVETEDPALSDGDRLSLSMMESIAGRALTADS